MQAMKVDEALTHADEWIKGVTLYEGAQGWHVVCATLAAEVRRLRTLAMCGCGDSFTEHDPGTCGNCLAGLDRTAEVARLRKALGKLKKVKYLYSTYASGSSRKSYGEIIDDAMGPNL